jgi:8-oxo-dGTP pyrophosphatase MutT (NUDIX family)
MNTSINATLEMKPVYNVVYRGKMFEIVEWEGKPGKTFEAAVRAPGVRLLIELSKEGQPGLLMTREIRREAGGWDYRLPGGKVFDTLGALDEFRNSGDSIESHAMIAAQREGREEAGIHGGDFHSIGVSAVGSTVEWDLHYFVVKNAQIGDQELEEAEQGDIETIVLTVLEIFEKLKNGEVKEGRSAAMLWWWLAKNEYIGLK